MSNQDNLPGEDYQSQPPSMPHSRDLSQEVLDELHHFSPEEPAYMARINLALVYAVRELTAEVRASREAREPGLIELTHGSPGQPDVPVDLGAGAAIETVVQDEPGTDRNGNEIEHAGLTRLAELIQDESGTDYGTAKHLADNVFMVLTMMRRESLGQAGSQPGDPVTDRDSPASWAILHEREGTEPDEPEDADYQIDTPGTIREAASPDA